MSNFQALNNYQIPVDLLLNLLSIYKLLGKNEFYESTLSDKREHLERKIIEEDTLLIVNYLKINLSSERTRLLITKDSTPRNKEEKMVTSIKRVLMSIRRNACEEYTSINSSDILDYLKHIYGMNIRFNSDDFKIHGKVKRSIRYEFNTVLDEYNEYFSIKKYEPIILSCITIMEMYNIKPYSEYNPLALMLTYYFLLLRCKIISFKYVSFIKLYLEAQKEVENAIAAGSINYDQGTLFFSTFVKLTLQLISKSYLELEKIVTESSFEKRARKSDHIEVTILKELPDLFSKEDITEKYPDVSLSTIMRTLSKLHKKNYIIPLGKGRSAKWKRIVNSNDIKFAVGVANNEDTINNN